MQRSPAAPSRRGQEAHDAHRVHDGPVLDQGKRLGDREGPGLDPLGLVGGRRRGVEPLPEVDVGGLVDDALAGVEGGQVLEARRRVPGLLPGRPRRRPLEALAGVHASRGDLPGLAPRHVAELPNEHDAPVVGERHDADAVAAGDHAVEREGLVAEVDHVLFEAHPGVLVSEPRSEGLPPRVPGRGPRRSGKRTEQRARAPRIAGTTGRGRRELAGEPVEIGGRVHVEPRGQEVRAEPGGPRRTHRLAEDGARAPGDPREERRPGSAEANAPVPAVPRRPQDDVGAGVQAERKGRLFEERHRQGRRVGVDEQDGRRSRREHVRRDVREPLAEVPATPGPTSARFSAAASGSVGANATIARVPRTVRTWSTLSSRKARASATRVPGSSAEARRVLDAPDGSLAMTTIAGSAAVTWGLARSAARDGRSR